MPKDFQKDEGVMFIKRVPKTLRNMFKTACTRRGKSMRIILLGLMHDYVKNDRKYDMMKSPNKRLRLSKTERKKRFKAASCE